MLNSKPAELKFVADVNLGTLARWLRLLGYDTRFDRGAVNREFLRRAQQEGRIVLTRKRDMANRQFSGRLIVIQEDRVQQQLIELMEKMGINLDTERLYTRCAVCNTPLADISKCEVEGLVPDFVCQQCDAFRRCPDCGKIYWTGTHRSLALEFLRTRIPSHHP